MWNDWKYYNTLIVLHAIYIQCLRGRVWKAVLHSKAPPDTSMLLHTTRISKNTYALFPKSYSLDSMTYGKYTLKGAQWLFYPQFLLSHTHSQSHTCLPPLAGISQIFIQQQSACGFIIWSCWLVLTYSPRGDLQTHSQKTTLVTGDDLGAQFTRKNNVHVNLCSLLFYLVRSFIKTKKKCFVFFWGGGR